MVSEAVLGKAQGSPQFALSMVDMLFEEGLVVLEGVHPVSTRSIDRWIRSGIGGEVVVKRLEPELPDEVMDAVQAEGRAFLGKPYDGVFGWSDDAIYCSELVYKAYDRGAGVQLGVLEPVASFDLSSPEVQELLNNLHKINTDKHK